MGGSARNSIDYIFAILGSKKVIFRRLKISLTLCFSWWGYNMGTKYQVSFQVINKKFSNLEGRMSTLGGSFFVGWNFLEFCAFRDAETENCWALCYASFSVQWFDTVILGLISQTSLIKIFKLKSTLIPKNGFKKDQTIIPSVSP